MQVMTPDAMPPMSESMLRQAFKDVQEGRAVEDGRVRAALLASWQRTMQWGLRPRAWSAEATQPQRLEVQRVIDTNDALIDVVGPRLQALHRGLPAAQRWVVLCVNTQGLIVHSVGNSESAPPLLQAAMQVGRSVREADMGTTAAGCALMDQSAQVIRRAEHYLHDLHSLVCAAVPFWGPDGELAGVIDLTGIGVTVDPVVMHRLGTVARQIENDMVMRAPDRTVLRLNDDPAMVGTAYEGLVSLDAAERTCYLNAAARRLLGQPEAAAGPIDVELLFERADWRRMVDSRGGERPRMQQVRDRRGYLLHAARVDRLSAPPPMVAGGLPSVGGVSGSPAAGATVQTDSRVAWILRTGVKALQRGVPVILEGESGTGKEVTAQAIHRQSVRAAKPLVAINCAAIPEGLIEAELFGYVDGAFTGGRRGGCPGKIAQADGGTLFLDEIGDMPLGLQTRLLRVLQERQVTPVGGLHPVPVEFALICATHRNLAEAVARGNFRGDLFYRINGLALRLPALRERHDLKALVQRFLRECDGPAALHDKVYGLFASYHWPGNIRQLRNVILAASVLADDKPVIGPEDLPDALRQELGLGDATSAIACDTPLATAERDTIRRTLSSVDGNVTRAAAILGISRSTLHKRLRSFGLR
jgi:transcriptional regulator of acetoin/glycerol metabolism